MLEEDKVAMIALTFDDGPNNDTITILDTLKNYNAKATFFLEKRKISGNEDIVRRIVDEGNEVGNHSIDHPYFTEISLEEVRRQIDETQHAIYDACGIFPKVMRPPFGAINEDITDVIDLPIILWSVDPSDWNTEHDAEYISNYVIDNATDGDVILMHDWRMESAKAVEIIVSELTKRNYQFVTISELIQFSDLNHQKIFYRI